MLRRYDIFNYAFQDISVIFVAAILKNSLCQLLLHWLNINSLMLSHDISLNNMKQLNQSVNIWNHKS